MPATFKPIDIGITATALFVWSYAWIAGYQDWVAATSVVLVPLYLFLYRREAA